MAAINLLARGYKFDVSTDGTDWVHPLGLDNLSDKIDPNLQDANEYDSDGWSGSEITMQNWSLVTGMHRKADGGVEDPGQKLIRNCRGKFGDDARLYVRWYRTDGIDEAWSGRAVVGVENRDTAVENIAAWTVTFTGDGVATPITNPYSATVSPVVSSVSPATGATAGGDLVTILGSGFSGATAVTFDSVAAEDFAVVSDSRISAITPAGTAGAADVVVTTAAGTGTGTGAYTYA